jgi:hypothetical protein
MNNAIKRKLAKVYVRNGKKYMVGVKAREIIRKYIVKEKE